MIAVVSDLRVQYISFDFLAHNAILVAFYTGCSNLIGGGGHYSCF